jgi:hypothetical protein
MTVPDRCDACGRDLAGPDDPDYFDEPAYLVRLLPSQRPGGRPYLVLCPTCPRRDSGYRWRCGTCDLELTTWAACEKHCDAEHSPGCRFECIDPKTT